MRSSASSRDVPPERPAAGTVRLGRDPKESLWDFEGRGRRMAVYLFAASRANSRRRFRKAHGAGSVVVVFVAAGAADHDLVLLDRDLDGPVAGPVLGVHGVVLDGGVEPQAVALLAVVERALERPGGALAAAAARPRGGVLRRLLLLFGGLLLGRLARGLLGGLRLLLCAAHLLRLELGGDRLVVGRAKVDLVGGRAVGGPVAVGLQPVLALERLDLLDCDFELMSDPRVGATLSHPSTDLVKLRAQRPAAHEQAGRLAKPFGCRPHGERDAVRVV